MSPPTDDPALDLANLPSSSRTDCNPSYVDLAYLHFSTAGESSDAPAWTEIAPGRFLPRRVRGSAHGRALG
jgi:hypothetical protein